MNQLPLLPNSDFKFCVIFRVIVLIKKLKILNVLIEYTYIITLLSKEKLLKLKNYLGITFELGLIYIVQLSKHSIVDRYGGFLETFIKGFFRFLFFKGGVEQNPFPFHKLVHVFILVEKNLLSYLKDLFS